jgi:CheY-like chemotaxis protein
VLSAVSAQASEPTALAPAGPRIDCVSPEVSAVRASSDWTLIRTRGAASSSSEASDIRELGAVTLRVSNLVSQVFPPLFSGFSRLSVSAERAIVESLAVGRFMPDKLIRVLLVDDSDAFRRSARRYVSHRRDISRCRPRGRGRRLHRHVGLHPAAPGQIGGRHRERIHLLVTDVVMPGVGGPELASRLEAARPGFRVLYMSGYTGGAVVNHGLLSSATAYLQKPFTPDVLLRKVREVLDA